MGNAFVSEGEKGPGIAEGTEKVHVKQDLSCNKLRSFLFQVNHNIYCIYL